MSFKRMLAGMGMGGATVETTLTNPNVKPGGNLSGFVTVTGGQVEQQVSRITVALVARVEVESGDREFATTIPFVAQQVWGSFTLAPSAKHGIQFSLQLPWEAPITVLGNAALRGMFVGLQTEVEIARSVDKGDLDQVFIHPLPAQERILAALSRLGFGLKSADLERGRIHGSNMPFYQEIEYYPSREFARFMNELEVTFLSGPASMDVVLEADGRGSLFAEGSDTYRRFRVDYAAVDRVDWEVQLRHELQQMAARRGWF